MLSNRRSNGNNKDALRQQVKATKIPIRKTPCQQSNLGPNKSSPHGVSKLPHDMQKLCLHRLVHRMKQKTVPNKIDMVQKTPIGATTGQACARDKRLRADYTTSSKQGPSRPYSDGGDGHFFLYVLPSARLYDITL